MHAMMSSALTYCTLLWKLYWLHDQSPVTVYRGEVSDAMMAALGLDVGVNLSAEERFKQVAAVMKRRDAQDRREQKELRHQQKLDKKVTHSMHSQPSNACVHLSRLHPRVCCRSSRGKAFQVALHDTTSPGMALTVLTLWSSRH